MQYFFFSFLLPGLRHARAVIVTTGPCAASQGQSLPVQGLAGDLPVEVFYRLSSFNVSLLLLLLLRYLFFFFLALLFVVKMKTQWLCVVVSTGGLLFLLFRVTHLVVFITSYFYSVGPAVFFLALIFFCGLCLILDFEKF